MNTKKEIKRRVKEVDKRVKRFRSCLTYLGEVEHLCNIYRHVKHPVAGNFVCVRNGAVHFKESPCGHYVRINKKYVDISNKDFTGKIPEDAVRYVRVQDYDVIYIHTGTAWIKCMDATF